MQLKESAILERHSGADSGKAESGEWLRETEAHPGYAPGPCLSLFRPRSCPPLPLSVSPRCGATRRTSQPLWLMLYDRPPHFTEPSSPSTPILHMPPLADSCAHSP